MTKLEQRERNDERERHLSIELSDQEYFDKIYSKLAKIWNKQDSFLGILLEENEMSSALKENVEEARKCIKDTKVIDLREKDEKSKNKVANGKAKKNPSKSNKTAMASLQEKL